MSRLPKGWLETTLGEVVDYGTTLKAEPDEISDDEWVLELEDIEKDKSRIVSRLTFADRKSKSTKNRFSKGDVLYGKLRPYLNKVVLADSNGLCTTEIIPIKQTAAVDNRYVFHWLRGPRFLSYAIGVSHGLNMPRLGTDAGRSAPFILPPLAEQKRIADKLDSVLSRVEAACARMGRVPTILTRLRRAALVATLLGQDGDAKPTPRIAFGSLINSIRGGTTAVPQSDKTAYPILRSSSVRQGRIDFEDVRYLTSEQSGEEKNFIRENDVLFTRLNGNVNYVGNCAVVPSVSLNKYQSPDRLYRARLKETIVPKYCAYAFALPDIRKEIERRAKSSAGHKRISIQDIKEMEIPLPPVAEQLRMVNQIERIFATCDRLEKTLDEAKIVADHLTPALLAKAFRGELVGQDPNDESAEQLLERLKALTTSLGTKGKRSRQSATAAEI